MANIILQTNIADQQPKRGKVRDIYNLGDNLLIVATDRLSAFDVIMTNGIPYKGQVLNQVARQNATSLRREVGASSKQLAPLLRLEHLFE